MKKKVLALFTCVAMVATLFAGCGSSAADTASEDTAATEASSDVAEAPAAEAPAAEAPAAEAASDIVLDGTWPETTIKIGVEVYDTADDQFLAYQTYLEYLKQYYNIDFMYSESIGDATAELDFINSCASAGCQAVIGYYNISKEEAAKAAINQGMYYWGCDSDIYEAMKDDPMYVGRYLFSNGQDGQNGDYLGGYQLAYGLAQNGCKHVFYCNGGAGMGIQMFIDRQTGFEAGIAAAQADGMDITFDASTDIVEGWPDAADFAANVGTMLAGDYDGVAASFNAAALFQPISEAGKMESMKIATIGEVCDTYYDLVQAGAVSTVVYDCEEVVFGNAVMTIINAVNGHSDIIRQEDGTAASTPCERWTITDADTYNAIYNYHNGGNFFISAEDMATCFPEFNADASYETACDLYNSMTAEAAAAKAAQ